MTNHTLPRLLKHFCLHCDDKYIIIMTCSIALFVFVLVDPKQSAIVIAHPARALGVISQVVMTILTVGLTSQIVSRLCCYALLAVPFRLADLSKTLKSS